MRYHKICTFLGFGLLSTTALTAEVRIGNDELNTGAIFITGQIEKGDYEKVESITRDYINVVVKGRDDKLKYILNSEGGDVGEAIKIGLLFRKSLAQVYVWGNRLIHESEQEAQWILNERQKGWAQEYATQNSVVYSDGRPLAEADFKKCYSACVLMFLGGVQKQVSDNHYWVNGFRADETSDVPVIGLHRPYVSQEQYAGLSISEAEGIYKNLEEAVRNYLREIGATQELADRMFKSASNEIDLVKDSDFRSMFHQEEPYFKEWILARCGASDDGAGILSDSDYKYKNDVWNAKTEEVRRLINSQGGGPEDYMYIYEDYIPAGFSREKYEEILARVSEHNLAVRRCEESSVTSHQMEMFAAQEDVP
ncbi:hypothetical protein GCM10011403_00040 [Pseudohongiella nitratireducens]|uniref:Uncharacterized protein n=1 Tax=Pseudohongiella nitratireducens TaxID=1768907 RepID=A0A917GIA8_9GAMM|nr:hypothetical protein [Pseudohongiella nitratireducens]GGG46920.1 hypothetical protein GCM10011403_00040 [Pseudohongiella nitratireducens]